MFQGCTGLFMQDLGENGSGFLVTNDKRDVKWPLVWMMMMMIIINIVNIIIINDNSITLGLPRASDQCLKQLNFC